MATIINLLRLTGEEKEILLRLIAHERLHQDRTGRQKTVILNANHSYYLLGFEFKLSHSIIVRESKNFLQNNEYRVEVLSNQSAGSGGYSSGVYSSLATLRLTYDGENLLPVKSNDHQRISKLSQLSKNKNFITSAVENEYQMNWQAGLPVSPPVLMKERGSQGIKYRSSLTMEWVAGNNLLERRNQQIDPIELTLAIIVSIIEELQKYHNRGIIHCDIKLENIVVQTEPFLKVRIVDLGLAQFQHLPHLIKTTPGYAAPELTPTGFPTISSDIFALGRTIALYLGDSGQFLSQQSIGQKKYRFKDFKNLAQLSPGQQQQIELALNATQAELATDRIDLESLKSTFSDLQADFVIGKTEAEILDAIDRAFLREGYLHYKAKQQFADRVFVKSVEQIQSKLLWKLYELDNSPNKRKLLAALLLSTENCLSSLKLELKAAIGTHTLDQYPLDTFFVEEFDAQKFTNQLLAILSSLEPTAKKLKDASQLLNELMVKITPPQPTQPTLQAS